MDGSGDNTTFQPIDSIDGGGGDDTMDLRLLDTGGGAANSSGRQVSNLENLNIQLTDTNDDDSTSTVDTADFDDSLTSINIDKLRAGTANEGVEVTELGANDALSISGSSTNADVTFTYANNELDGNSDEVAVNFEGGDVADLTVNGAAESLAIDASNDAATIGGDANVTGNLADVSFSGNQDVTIQGQLTGFAGDGDLSVDASNLDADLTFGAQVEDRMTITGTGNATRVNADLANGDLTSNFEATNLGEFAVTQNGQGNSVNFANVSGLSAAGQVGTQDVTFNSLDDGSTIYTMRDEVEDRDNNIVLGNLTADIAAANEANPANSLTVEISNNGTNPDQDADNEATLQVGNITANDVKDLTISASDADAQIDALSNNAAESLIFEGAEDVDVTNANDLGTDATAAGGKNSLSTIDASNVDGAFDANFVANAFEGDDNQPNVTITGAAGADTLSLGTQNFQNNQTLAVDTGGGDDVVTVNGEGGATKDANAIAQQVNTGAGDDTINLATNNLDSAVDHSIDGGGGSDTLAVQASADWSQANLSNIESIQLTANNVALDNGLSGNSVDITDLSGGGNIATFVGGDVDLSGYSVASGNAGARVTLLSDEGADTLTGMNDSAADEDFVLADFNQADTITDFDTEGDGAGADRLIIDNSGTVNGAGAPVNTFVDGTNVLTSITSNGVVTGIFGDAEAVGLTTTGGSTASWASATFSDLSANSLDITADGSNSTAAVSAVAQVITGNNTATVGSTTTFGYSVGSNSLKFTVSQTGGATATLSLLSGGNNTSAWAIVQADSTLFAVAFSGSGGDFDANGDLTANDGTSTGTVSVSVISLASLGSNTEALGGDDIFLA